MSEESEVRQKSSVLGLLKSAAIDIEFEGVVCTVPDGRKGKKQILADVSGKFKSGELTAIMGPSGAGKTTLMNILTGFRTGGGETTGTVRGLGENKKLGTNEYRKKSCYIPQDDELAPLFTVDEIMTMAADLKLGASLSPKAKRMLIEDILESLGLAACKEVRCERISGGQKKRLSIALELIDNPPIMFLDEPTTGLDSACSLQCIALLRALARDGRTIVCTIHQPSATLYGMFDHVYALANGRCVYQGASGNTVAYLSSVALHCPQYHNPADFLVEVANGDYGDATDLLARTAKLKDWRNAAVRVNNSTTTKESSDRAETTSATGFMKRPSEWLKFWVLMNRSFLQISRDWTFSHLKVLVHSIVGIFLGLTYYQAGNDGSKMISNMGFLLVTAVYLSYTSLMPAILKYPSEISVLKKERFNNWYNLKTYYAAMLLSDIPMQVIFSIAYTSFAYVISDQPKEWDRFLRFLGICILVTLTASSFGLFLGTSVTPVNGIFVGAVWTAVMLLLAGFFIFYRHMPNYLYYFTYTSFISFSVEGLAQAVYGYDRGAVPCPEDVDYCHFKMPIDLLEEMGVSKPNYWVDVGYLLSTFVVLRIAAFCTLRRRLKRL